MLAMRNAFTSWSSRGTGARDDGKQSDPATGSGGDEADIANANSLLTRRRSTAAATEGKGVTEYPMGLGMDEDLSPSPSPSPNNVSLVSSSDGDNTATTPSASSVETGPQPSPQKQRTLQQQQPATPARAVGGGGGAEDDHPLSPRYLSYRSSLASRLSSSASSSPVRTTAGTTSNRQEGSVRDLVAVFSGSGGCEEPSSPPRLRLPHHHRVKAVGTPSPAAVTAAATTPKSSGGRKGNNRPNHGYDNNENIYNSFSTPSDEDRNRRIAAAMLVSDDEDSDTDNCYGVSGGQQHPRRDRESFRDRLNRRLERNQAGSTPTGKGGPIGSSSERNEDEDDAVIAGQAAVAAVAATYSSLVEEPPHGGSPVREFTVHNSAINRSSGNASTTPLSAYSATSSLTDPNFSGVYSLPGLTMTPGGAGASAVGAATTTPPPDRLRSWNNYFDPAVTNASAMDDVTADPIFGPRSSPLSTTMESAVAEEALAKIGDEPVVDHENSLLGVASTADANAATKSPTCLLGPALPQEASRRRRRQSGMDGKPYYVWLLLGGGVLLLLTALALAIAFLVTRRGGDGTAPSPANNGTSSTATTPPEENDPDWAALFPSFYPAQEPSSSTNDDVPVGSRVPSPSVVADARPTRAPSRRPSRSPTTPVPSISAEDRELLDVVVKAYEQRLGADPNATAADFIGSGGDSSSSHSARHRAFGWLARSHDGPTRQRLGIDRLVQRYALATFYYATNGTVLDRIGDDDYYYQYVGDPGGSSSWLGSGDECDWLAGICRQGWVTNLKLDGAGLLGSIPPELALLTGLTELNLSQNNMGGTLPTELGALTKLRRLNLRDNRLTGTIPAEYRDLDSVEILRLDGNDLTGSVPQQVCQAYYNNYNATLSYPQLYLDCGGADPKITCPPGICCTYCCANGSCDCVFEGSALENDLC